MRVEELTSRFNLERTTLNEQITVIMEAQQEISEAVSTAQMALDDGDLDFDYEGAAAAAGEA